jgi:hypothetical protein
VIDDDNDNEIEIEIEIEGESESESESEVDVHHESVETMSLRSILQNQQYVYHAKIDVQ